MTINEKNPLNTIFFLNNNKPILIENGMQNNTIISSNIDKNEILSDTDSF